MNETEMKQKIVEYINSMGIDEKIALHNTYCDAINFEEDHIYAMDDMQKVLYGMDTRTLIDMMWRGNFDFQSDFWGIDERGNLVSYDALELPISPDDIADYIFSKKDSLGNDEIQYMLDREVNFDRSTKK